MLGAVLFALVVAGGAAPTPASAEATAGIDWLEVIARRPPLRHERGERWPLILWEGIGFEPQPRDVVDTMLARGVVQHVRVDGELIETAQALQAAGAPVIMMEGRSGVWPYDLAPPGEPWRHRYAEEARVPEAWRALPSPAHFSGWAVAAEHIRRTLKRYKHAGVTVDAVWLDYEGEPSMASYAAAVHSTAARLTVPAQAMSDASAFRRYRRQLWLQLLSAYVAAPVREVFPRAAVTNWVYAISTPEHPVLDWTNRPHPASGPTLFSHTNPVAYAIDSAFRANRAGLGALDQAGVDRVYMHVMLRQVSADALNRQQLMPYLGAVVWVGRWVRDHPEPTPVMSRGRYREALRHIWLRGVDAMEVFNPVRAGDEAMAVADVVDALAVYDEMLAYRDFLDDGRVLNVRYPRIDDDGPLWSGLALGDRAVIRLVHQGGPGSRGEIALNPWPGYRVVLEARDQGRTYLLEKSDESGRVDVLPQLE